jgi:hypothetical protein
VGFTYILLDLEEVGTDTYHLLLDSPRGAQAKGPELVGPRALLEHLGILMTKALPLYPLVISPYK